MSRKCALVTGAGRGIGRAVSVRLSKVGYDIAAVARSKSELDETGRLVEASGAGFVAIVDDLADPRSTDRIVTQTQQSFGRVDVLINNAAVGLVASMDTLDAGELERCVNVNIRAVVAVCRAVWPVMRSVGGGVIVNVSSYAAIDPFTGLGIYGGTKAFLHPFTRSLADEGREHGIRAYVVALGAVETRMLRSAFPEFPAEQCLAPDDVAGQVELLLDERNRFSSGGTIFVRK